MQEAPPAPLEGAKKPLFGGALAALLEPVAALALVLGGVILAAAFYAVAVGERSDGPGPSQTVLAITVQAGLMAAVAFRLRAFHGLAVEAGPGRVSTPGGLALLALLGGPLVLAASLLAGILSAGLGLEVREQAWLLEQLTEPRRGLLLAPWIVLLAPWAEELFFRGYVQRRVEERLGGAAGLGFASLMFAVIHWNPAGLLVYFAIGCMLGALYRLSRKLWIPILAHAVHNALILLGLVGLSGS